MLRLPPSDLLTATHPFETLAGNSKTAPFGVLKHFPPLAPPHPKFLCAGLCANSRPFNRIVNLQIVSN